jgi:hypothetical protein
MSVHKDKTTDLEWFRAGLDAIVKYGAALGTIGLTTAFIFNFIFWYSVDRRIISFLVMSDYIQTAVLVVGLLFLGSGAGGLSLLIMYFFIVWLARQHLFVRIAVPMISLLILVICLFRLNAKGLLTSEAWSYSDWSEGQLPLSLVALVAAIGFLLPLAISFNPIFKSMDAGTFLRKFIPRKRRYWLLIYIGFVIAFYAIIASDRSVLRHTVDAVFVENGSQFIGDILGTIDKGVILRDRRDGHLIFLPKERVQRVDYDVPAGK